MRDEKVVDPKKLTPVGMAVKGGIVATIYVILAIRECGQGLSGKVGLMLVPDEETGRRKARRRYDDNELLEIAYEDLQRWALPR